MIDSRFSAEAFSKRGIGTMEARELADELQDEIEAEAGAAAKEVLRRIVDRLNGLGHELEVFEESENWIDYRQHWRDAVSGHHGKLRVGVHITASAGYPHSRVSEAGDT